MVFFTKLRIGAQESDSASPEQNGDVQCATAWSKKSELGIHARPSRMNPHAPSTTTDIRHRNSVPAGLCSVEDRP